MIIKSPSTGALPADPRLRAGAEAERQMAFYLHRAFADDPDLLVFNDLRLVDPQQPEADGRPGACQIDHLVLHRWGVFIIESKSVTDEVAVRGDGAGGDEWTRRYDRREHGFPSPIQQARRQGEFLRTLLDRRKTQLLGKAPTGFRTIAKLVAGTDQRGFGKLPIQLIVAISDRGKIRRADGWTEPSKPFRTFVSKADLVPDKIRAEFETHRAGSNLLSQSHGDYGIWSMKAEELLGVAQLLAASDEPRTPPPSSADRTPANAQPITPPDASPSPTPKPAPAPSVAAPPPTLAGPSCKACGSGNLSARWGHYGYYWKCLACEANTSMPTLCTACGAQGQRGQIVSIRKDGPRYFRVCARCGIDERVWTEPTRS